MKAQSIAKSQTPLLINIILIVIQRRFQAKPPVLPRLSYNDKERQYELVRTMFQEASKAVMTRAEEGGKTLILKSARQTGKETKNSVQWHHQIQNSRSLFLHC